MYIFFFFNDTATTEIYTLSLHDALPICAGEPLGAEVHSALFDQVRTCDNHCEFCFIYQLPPGLRSSLYQKDDDYRDRKSTRLNSSHANISYAVFCLKKKKIKTLM